MRRALAFLCVGLLAASSLHASGFQIYEFGGKASAFGGAVVARAWDGSTIFYNPSGLAFTTGTKFYGGTTLILPSAKFVGAAPMFGTDVHETKSAVFTPIGLYFSHKFNDQLGAGIGVTNPYGLGVEWEDDFPGRAISRNAQLASFYISPVLAYKITPNIAIGGGVDIVLTSVTLERNVNVFDSPGSPGYEVGEVKLEGDSDVGLGFTASLQVRTERFGFGFLYRHSVENKFNEGTADFTVYNNLSVPNVAAVAQNILVDTKANTAIDFPSLFTVGVYYRLLEKLGIEIDYMRVNWSVFDKIVLDFPNDELDQTIPEEYEDSWQLRVGAHYDVSDKLTLRAGYIYDQTPQPIQSVSPLLPDANRNDFAFGLGYNFGKYQIDLGYMFVDFEERSTIENGVGKNDFGFNGTYNSQASLLFLSFGIDF